MTAFAEVPALDRSSPRASVLLWSTAAAAALALHTGLVAWLLRAPPPLPADGAAPAAVMIDLAPEPVAPEAPEAISPDAYDAPEVPEAPEAIDEPLTPPVETPTMTALEPPPDLATPEEIALPTPETVPPVEVPPELPPSEVAVAPPVARPRTLRVPEKTEPAPTPVKEPPSESRTRAAVQAPAAETAAAQKTTSGSAGSVSPARWKSRLMAHLERRKRYPTAARRRGEEGVAYVRFAIDGEGNVLSAALARSSGSADLDAAVIDLVRRASPVPAPPPDAPREITAPVQFNIR